MTERPEGVPAEALWVEDDAEWELGGRDEAGRKHGPYRYWRADGTLANECLFAHGVPNGPFKRFHENGEVSQEGTFVDGKIHGTRRWFVSSEETSEHTLAPGMSSQVTRSEMDYDLDRVVATRHYDGQGRRVLPLSGAPYPDRPAGVPDQAELREREERWMFGALDDANERTGTWRVWTLAGVLVEDGEWKAGERHGAWKEFHDSGKPWKEGRYVSGEQDGLWQIYAPDGSTAQTITFAMGERHGPYEDRRCADEYEAPIAGERGTCEHDYAVGEWQLLDDTGRVVRTLDLGRVAEKLEETPALAAADRAPEEWRKLASSLVSEGRVREGIVAEVRAVGKGAGVEPLRTLLAERTLPRKPEAARGLAVLVVEDAGQYLGPLLDTIMRGGDVPRVLARMAGNYDRDVTSGIALDLIEGAMRLDPARKDLHFTRALIAVSLGRPDLAEADVDAGAPHDERIDAFLRDYVRVIFTTYDFWPARDTPDTYYEGLPDVPAQSLEAVKLAVKKYATRLGQLREEMIARVGEETSWMPPDLEALLPDGEVELEVSSFETAADEDQGEDLEADDPDEEADESSPPRGTRTVEIDELPAIGDQADLPGLLRQARGDWSALTWLLWSVGETEVRLPTALRPHPEFGKAAGMASQRLWRCRDKVHMHGMSAREFNVPGFTWEGKDIDDLHGFVAEIAEHQYAETQAMFRWLSDPAQRSPWQDDLRAS